MRVFPPPHAVSSHNAHSPFRNGLRFVPPELQQQVEGRDAHVSVENKRDEDYKEPPKPAYVAFSGAGRTLG